MKSYSNFLSEAVEPAQKAWTQWLDNNPQATKPGGKFHNDAARDKAAKEFMKTFQKTGKAPDWAAAGQSTQAPPRQAAPQPEPPKPKPAAPKPPAQPPGGQQKPPANWKSKAGTGVRRTFGAISALDAAAAAKEGRYGDAVTSGLLAAQGSRRLTKAVPELGRRAVQAGVTRAAGPAAGKIASRFVPGLGTAYGLVRGTQAAMRGDQLGAALGYGSAIPVVGGAFAAADIARDVMPQELKNKIAQTVGYRRTDTAAAQTKKDIEKLKARPRTSPSQVLSTMQTRSTRQQASKAGVYGATQGSAIVGTGGKTTFDTKKNTITTGGKTAALPKTKVLPGGAVGDLAYRNGKPVYLARASMAQRGNQSLLARLSRATGIGGQRQRDAAALAKERQTAMANTLRYRQQLGITGTGASINPNKK